MCVCVCVCVRACVCVVCTPMCACVCEVLRVLTGCIMHAFKFSPLPTEETRLAGQGRRAERGVPQCVLGKGMPCTEIAQL